MLTKLFFPTSAGVRVDRVWWEGPTLHLAATTTRRTARCPLCHRRSKRVHSRYGRTIADLPCAGAVVTLHLRTRRFVCRVRWCRRKVFTERLPALVAPSARRTNRLRAQLQRTGFDLGGAPGAQHATATGMPVSRRTLLRLVRAAPVPEAGAVRVLGVDDWAQKRGRTYGTILVNLETQEVIDLLPDRGAQTLAAWLQQHPEVEIISRDRGGAYADGARQGAPQAVQVADRFHLVKNVIESLDRFLTHKHQDVRHANHALCPPAPEMGSADQAADPAAPAVPSTRVEQIQQERRARRHARYEEVMALHAAGYSLRAIARRVRLSRHTVQRFVRADGFPERKAKARRRTLLTPYEPYLRARWESGEQNATLLWQEIRAQGYQGCASNVRHHLASWRTGPARRRYRRICSTSTTSVSAPPTYTTRQTVWLLLRPLEELSAQEQNYLTHLYHACPHVALAQTLVQEFRTLLRERNVTDLYVWLRSAGACPIQELRAVARRMWLDQRAIEAAVTLDWSQGQTEGQVNRLKVLKRTMYGRAKFDLLRTRVLHAA